MEPEPAPDADSVIEHDGPYFEPHPGVASWGEWADVPPDETLAPASSRRASRGRHVVREVVETGVLAILVFLCVRATFGTYNVEGRSMDPTLQDGEFLFVSKLQYTKLDVGRLGSVIPFLGSDGYLLGAPSRGDVIVLKDPRSATEKDLVKRIIGLPGETVEIVNGRVYINGRLLDEPYIASAWTGNKPKLVVPAKEYYVLGDNRENSSDSRFFGLVPEDLIEGRAVASPWPPAKFGTDLGVKPTLAAEVTRP